MYKVAGGIIVYMYCEEVFDVYYCIVLGYTIQRSRYNNTYMYWY